MFHGVAGGLWGGSVEGMSQQHWSEHVDPGLRHHRLEMFERNTRGLKTGWYILTGFFWHDRCSYVDGPFDTRNDALRCRDAIESREGHRTYYVDELQATA